MLVSDGYIPLSVLVSDGGYYITLSLCWVETLSVLVSNGGYYITLSVLVR